jgi:4'-phosphopantetheinyl transferase EntD
MNLSNPARLSSSFQALFPPGIIAAESDQPGRVDLLLPAEAACLGRAVPERQQEFAAGRLCARRALAELDIENFALIAAPDRQPIWPAAIVGSITHTAGLCAAVVASGSRFAALGVDTEIVGRVTAELRTRICVASELDWIDSLPEARRAAASALVFAAKEAFYKCQSPLTGQWLGFQDVRIEAAADTFRVIPTRPIALTEVVTSPLTGRYHYHQEFVSAGIALAR